MTEVEERSLREICQEVHGIVAPQVQALRTYQWQGSTESQRLEFVRRAAVVRQFEAATAILSLFDSGNGPTGAIMLRPAYEELLWIEYLDLCGESSLELVQLLTQKELRESYDAQKQFLGQKGIRKIGFYSKLSRRIEHGLKDPSKRLAALGGSLGWRKGASQPSVAFIARKVGREKQYQFLYQGTSRSVHFSPHELQRRVWGQHGSVIIGSSSFERYWSDFAMSWSFRLLVETMIKAGFTEIVEESDRAGGGSFGRLLRELRPVQILTASELEAWDEPKPDKLLGH